jgi:hypothetical protein
MILKFRCPRRSSVINLNLPVPLELARRKDDKFRLLARFVLKLRRLPQLRALNKG